MLFVWEPNILYHVSRLIQDIYVTKIHIKFFEENAFRGFSSLHNCQIPEMPPLNLVQRSLVTVRLPHNRLGSIPGEFLIGFLQLSTLDLSFNLLRSVSPLHPLSGTLEQLHLDCPQHCLQYHIHHSCYPPLGKEYLYCVQKKICYTFSES